jgi:hypothetical protein
MYADGWQSILDITYMFQYVFVYATAWKKRILIENLKIILEFWLANRGHNSICGNRI